MQYYMGKAQDELDYKFEMADISKDEFVQGFENYFLSNDLAKKGRTKGEFYKNILKYLEANGSNIPPVTEADTVAFAAGRLRISADEIEENLQMRYLSFPLKRYMEECPGDTISAFWAIGNMAEESYGIKHLSNNLFAATLNFLLTEDELNQSFYQETVVMFLWLRMALYYGE